MATMYDGFDVLTGGMNSAVLPTALSRREMAKGVNVDLRSGYAMTRPAFLKANDLVDGKFQGATVYRQGNKDSIIAAIDGHLYRIDPDTWEVLCLTTTIGAMHQRVDRLYFCQAGDHLIIQDGYNRPLILTGESIRSSNVGEDPASPEVPVGTIMAYGHGRLFVCVDKKYFMAGDIALPWEPDSVLKFTETTYLSGGGAFGLPATLGNITGMICQQNAVSGSGLGALVVFAEHGVCSFAINLARSTWNTSDISVVLFEHSGATGPAGIVPVNNDLIYRARDGIRSLRVTASTVSGGGALLRNIPLSERLQALWQDETEWTLPMVSGALYDNRLYYTAISQKHFLTNPEGERVEDYSFRALVVMDLKSLTEQAIVFEGIYTGLNFLQALTVRRNGTDTLVMLARMDDTDANAVWCMDTKEFSDNRFTQVTARIYTPAFALAPAPDDVTRLRLGDILKRYQYADVWLTDLKGKVDITLYVRSTEYPLWTIVGTATLYADQSNTGDNNVWPQNRYRVRMTSPLSVTEAAKLGNRLSGSELQFCLEWVGHARVQRFVVFAEPQPEDHGQLTRETTGAPLTGESIDDYKYAIGGV